MPHKRKDGRFWWASFTDASGKRVRRSTGTTNRKEAQALEAKWKGEIFQKDAWNIDSDHTFEELMLSYLRASALEKRSIETDYQRTKQLKGFFAGKVMNVLRPADVRGYIDLRRQSGVANSTINRELSLLSAAIKYGQTELEWDIPNPVKGRKLSEPEGRVRSISRAEADGLIDTARQSTKASYLADYIVLSLHTGCRKQELLGLEWDRVDLSRNLIWLEASHTKTAKRRSVPLNHYARETIINRARFRAEHCPDSRWVFANSRGERIGDVKKSFGTACKRAGISDFRMHDMRHTCAAWLVSSGVSLIEVRDLLGHSTIKMTERYAHLAPENLRKAVRTLENRSHSGHSDLQVPETPMLRES
jgi:integrase